MEEKILELLEEKPYTYKALRRKLKIYDDAKLQTILKNLELTGKIYYTEEDNYILFPKNFKIGKIQISKTKNIYIVLKNGTTKHIYKENLNGALNYDTVVLNMDTIKIEKVLDREISHIVCEVKEKDKIKYIEPYNILGNFKVRIASSDMKHLHDGDRIIVDVSLEKSDEYFEGNYLKTFGTKNDPDIELKSIAISNGFSPDFNEECLEQLKTIPQIVREEDLEDRLDLRKKIIFTIDGKNTKDMDDAISIKKLENGNYLLGVHIADISHYIPKGSPLYEEAKDRATSLYMINSVIPMFPSEISNGIGSLNPHVDRLTLSCIMEITPTGELQDYRIRKSVINSKMKMTYEDVNKLLLEEEYPVSYEPFKEHLLLMQELSNILTIQKEQRGYLRFANSDIKFTENKEGKVIDIKKGSSGPSEELIENFMVMANSCIATHLGWIDFIPSVYRNHGIPDFTKVNTTIDFISSLGYRMRTLKNVDNAVVLQKILEQLSHQEEFPVLSTLLLKSMKRAEYNTHNIGHFALELPFYTHFTSPIRRFPDFQLHTILKEYTSLDLEHINLKEMEQALQEICHHASFKERQADMAEAEAQKLKMVEYMKDHLGETFITYITDITEEYIQVQTTEGIPGIILCPKDKWEYDSEKRKTTNLETQDIYKIGHTLSLTVKDVNLEKRMTIFNINENLTLQKKSNDKKLKKVMSI